MVQAVQQVHAGGAPMSLQIARKVINYFHKMKPASELEQLTARELEILRLLAKGYMYKEIADQLAISMSTVRTHVSAVYEKLHVHSRTEAAMTGRQGINSAKPGDFSHRPSCQPDHGLASDKHPMVSRGE